jgi:D-amino-acid dehydrogenase
MSVPQASRPKVTVIGAGIVGVCCASYLQRDGFDVDLVDPVEPGSEEQCSFGNAGGVCPGSCVPIAMPGMLGKVPDWLADPEGPLYIRLAYLPQALPWILRFLAAGRESRVREISDHMRALHRLTFECYEPLLAAAGCTDLIEHHGQLFIHETPIAAGDKDFGLSLRRERGVKVEILDAGSLRQLAPSVAPFFKSAVFLPEQGQCKNPGRLVAKLAEHVVRSGGRLIRRRVRGFECGPNGPRALLTDGESLPVEHVVVAAGAWSGTLAGQLGSPVPLESERGYHVVVRGVEVGTRVQTIWAERKFVATPMEMGLRFAGTVEFAGLQALPDMRRADVLLKQGRRMFPKLEVGEVTRWMGHRPGLPDTIPVISASPRHPNVFYAFGHGHMGLIGGSVTGRLIADLVGGKPTTIDVAPYRVDRFSLIS